MLRRTERIVLRDDDENPAEEPAGAPIRRGLNPLRPQPGDATPAEPTPAVEERNFENWREAAEPPPPNLSPEQRRNIERWRAEVLQSVASNDDGGEPGRLRRFFKPANIALMAVAILAGGGAAFLAMQPPPGSSATTAQIASMPAPEPETIVVEEPMAKVLVAKLDIGIGERLNAESVEWIDWPEDSLRPEFITAAAADADTGVDNAVARYDFVAGEPIRETKLTRSAEGFLSAVLEPGTRAVAVAVSAESASGGFVLPNDRVDIVHTTTVADRQVSSTILSNVRVLAINASLGRTGREDEESDAPKSRTFSSALATLALDPKQAEVIISATMSGRLSLVLRPTADVAEAQTDIRSRAANEAIRISSPFWAN